MNHLTPNGCNRLMNEKTLHPLISVIDLSKQTQNVSFKVDSYAVVLRHYPAGSTPEGRQGCDFTEATLYFHAPDKPIDLSAHPVSGAGGRMLIFHPSLFCGLPLAKELRYFTYFKYKTTEALHLSACELRTVERCLDHIESELEWGVDRFSASLLSELIATLLRYCQRYYERQFVLRHESSLPLLQAVTRQIDHYILSGSIPKAGQPCACHFAKRQGWSSAYLNDFLKHETGSDFVEYFRLRRVELARQMRLERTHKDAYIAHLLGFGSVAMLQRACPVGPVGH